MKKYATGGNNPKKKKPNLKKTDTFADYKTAASQFSDYNPESDTVFVGMSLDPGAAERQTQRSANISSAKGASDSNYNAIPKMYKTKNEEGKTVYVSLSKHSKYSQGGIMQSKKYRAGGQNPPQEDPKKKKATSLPPAPKPFGSMDAVRRTPSVMTPGEKAAAAAAAQARVTADSTKFFDDKWRYPEWQRYSGNASKEARAIGAGELARKKERERSAKKYSNGGQNPPQNKPTYGPPKPPGYKEPSKEEMKERQDEASYNKMRKELDRELASMKKRGATEDQINKYADKIISAWARNR